MQRTKTSWFALLALGGLGGCSDGIPEASVSCVRMLDSLERLEIDSALDLADADAVRDRTQRRFETVEADRLDGFHHFAGDEVRRRIGRTEPPAVGEPPPGVEVEPGEGEESPAAGVRLDGPAALWRPLSSPPGAGAGLVSHAIAVRLVADEQAAFRLCVLRLEDDAADLGAADLVSTLFHGRPPATVELRPDGEADPRGVSTFRAVHRWVDRHRYVLGLVVRSGTVRLLDVERARPTPLGVVLERTAPRPGASPWARRIARGGDGREALVLVAPGEVRWAVEVPAAGARLTLSAGHVVPDAEGGVELRVEVRDAAGERAAEVLSLENAGPAPLASWHDVELDLDAVAGQRAEVRVAAAPREGGDPAAIAIANPMMTARRDPSAPRPPDVVLVSLDTVRADRVSAYGYPRETTPTLAALAERSAVFTQAIAPAPWTLPSHVTILSGQLPDRHGVRHTSQRIDPTSVPMLARELRARGYRTVAVTGGGYVAPDFGFAEGFEEYRVGDPAPPLHLDSDVASEISAVSRRRIDEVLAEPRDRPVFLFAHTYVAHEYHAEVDDLVAVGMSRDEAAALDQDREWMSLRSRLRDRGWTTPFRDELRVLSRRYDGALRAADRLVAQVLEASSALERPDECLVVVLSDHGEELGEHGDFGHAHDLHEELLRVPLLFSGLGIEAGPRGAVVSLADVAPTVRDLLGLDLLPELTDGRSLVAVLSGERLASEPALAVSGTPTRLEKHALRGDRWKLKLTRGAGGARETFLYDLEGKGERLDVSAREPDRTDRIARRLDERVAALRALARSTETADLSPEREAELRALGYLGD